MATVANELSTQTAAADKNNQTNIIDEENRKNLIDTKIKDDDVLIKLNLLLENLSKDQACSVLITVYSADGVGDIEHFKAYVLKIKAMCPKINLIGIIGVYGVNLRACQKTYDFLAVSKQLFSKVYVSVNKTALLKGERFFDLPTEVKNKINTQFKPYELSFNDLKSIDEEARGFIQISTKIDFNDIKIQTWLTHKKTSLPYYVFPEYGSAKGTHPMNLKENGIRLLEEFSGEITNEKRIAKLAELNNKVFLKALVQNENLSSKSCSEYLNARILSPAYLQSELDVALFILTQLNVFKHKQKAGIKGCDFHLPESYLNNKILAELMVNLGFKENDWVIITDKNIAEKSNHNKCIRIFTNTLDDQDYKNLYYIANSISGASGDDTISTVFSTLAIPFYCNYKHPVKQDFIRDLIECLKKNNFLALKQFWDIFGLSIKYPIENNKFFHPSLFFHLTTRKSFSITNDLFSDTIPYLEFQKDLIKIFAEKFAKYIIENEAKIYTEINDFRNYLFKHRNIFSKLPAILSDIVNHMLNSSKKRPGVMLDIQNKEDAEEELHLRVQEVVNDIDFLKKSLLKKIPSDIADTSWQFNSERDLFWLKVKDQKKYEKLAKVQKLVTRRKIDKEENYVLFALPTLMSIIVEEETNTLLKDGLKSLNNFKG